LNEIVLIAAVAQNGVIGSRGGLPWRLPTDLKRFKSLTMGKPIVMGRKTCESIGRPLPGRMNIAISRNPDFSARGVDVAASLEEALQLAEVSVRGRAADTQICVIGGEEIYRQALPIADRLEIAHVLAEVDGDARFPEIDPAVWEISAEEPVTQAMGDSAPIRFVTYRRRAGSGSSVAGSR